MIGRALIVWSLLFANVALADRSELPPLATPGAQARLTSALRDYAHGVALLKSPPGSAETVEGSRLLEQAIGALRSLTEVEPRAWIYYALGQALRRRGDCDQAIEAYRQALAQAPHEPLSASAIADLIDRTKQQIANCVVDRPTTKAPPPAPPPVAEPAPAPAPVSVALAPAPLPAPAATSDDAPVPRPWWRDPAGGVLVGVGLGALAAGAGVLGYAESLARSQNDNLQAFADARGVPTDRVAGAITLSVGGALLIGGVIRWAVVAHQARRPGRATP